MIRVGDTIEFQALEDSLNDFEMACKNSSGERNFKDI
jgi:hypothetical protein